jgi:hypothetical protein
MTLGRQMLQGNPMELPYDDTVCYECGADLGDTPSTEASRFTETDPQFHGFCSKACHEKHETCTECHCGEGEFCIMCEPRLRTVLG